MASRWPNGAAAASRCTRCRTSRPARWPPSRRRSTGRSTPTAELENILRRHAKHDLTDRLVVQDAPLALLRDRVDVAQTAFERVLLEHRHRAAIVEQRIDDLA